MKIVFAIALIIGLSCTPMAAGQEKAADAEPAKEADVQEAEDAEEALGFAAFDASSMLEQAVVKELAYLKKVTKVGDETIAGLKFGMKPLIKKAAKDQDQMFVMPNSLNANLLQAIANAAEHVVPDKKLYAAYREDVDLRLRFDEEAAVGSFTLRLQSMVGLTTAQGPDCEKLARKLYDQGKINGMTFLMSQGSLGPNIKDADLKAILTGRQLQYFKEFNSPLATEFLTSPTKADPSAEERREKLTNELRKVIAMKIDQLDGEFKLSAGQRRKLGLVGKSILSKAVSKRLAAEAGYKQFIEASQAGDVEQPDPEVMSLAMASPVQLFESQSQRWDKFITGALNKEQKAAWEAMKKSQSSALQNSFCYMLVKAFGSQLNLTGKQQMATHKLMASHMRPATSGGMDSLAMMDSYRGLLDIKEAEFAEAMGDDNWQTFKPMMDQLMKQVKMMDDKKKAEEQGDE